MTYNWTTTGGTIASNGAASMSWTASATVGLQSVKITVSDGKGHSGTASWSIGVGIIHVQGIISTATTWKTGNVYVIESYVQVASTLTIDSGVVVKFGPGAYMSINATGTLNGNGTPTSKIVFTSIKDDANGGDINNDGIATTPAKDDWYGLDISGNTSKFTSCSFLYAKAGLDLGSNKSTVTSCVFAHNTDGLVALNAATGTTCLKNVFYNNENPLSASIHMSIDSSNKFHNPANATETNTYQQIDIANGVIAESVRWDSMEVPIVIKTYLQISGTLTIVRGAIVKFESSAYFSVLSDGTLNCAGTAASPIIFTSIKDDSSGGDNNGDGVNSTPDKGDWDGITVSGNNSTFSYCRFIYATKGFDLSGRASITHCLFAHNTDGLDIGGALANTVCTNNVMFDNITPMYANLVVNLDSTNIFHNPADTSQKNTNQMIEMTNGNITAAVTWYATEAALVFPTYLQVSATLTLKFGTVLKFESSAYMSILANGTVNGLTTAFFTSFKDDSIGGDSNGDGTGSSPAAGDWDGITNTSGPVHGSNITYGAN